MAEWDLCGPPHYPGRFSQVKPYSLVYLKALELGQDVLTFDQLAENDMAAVQPRRLLERNEELRAVGVLAGVGHGEQAGGAVLHQEVLIIELGTIDALTTSSIKVVKVTTLSVNVIILTVSKIKAY